MQFVQHLVGKAARHVAVRNVKTLLTALSVLALMLGGCSANLVSEASGAAQSADATWHQGFEEDTTGWLAQSTSGATGWCGDIQRYTAGNGPVAPSAGTGYAVISHGGCNDFYAEAFPTGSSPYAPTAGYGDSEPRYSESTPQGGYITAVDAYLDPTWADGTSFTYAVSVHLLEVDVADIANNPFRYFFLPLSKADGQLEVAGHEITEAGWYTIQAHMGDDGGELAVEFVLAQDDEILATQAVAPTMFTGEATEPVAFADVGTGYSFFDLAEGQSLAIDEHRYWLADRSAPAAAAPAPNVVEVTATGLSFDAPTTVPAGWTTLRFSNESEMHHFVLVERMPDGYGMAEQQADLAPVFQEAFDLMIAGEMDAAMAAFGTLPAWYQDVVLMGGPGLTAPGEISQATVYLEPGTYLLECYVKSNGIFHAYNPDPDVNGMVHEFTVTEATAATAAPTASITMTISSENGIQVMDDVAAGEQTVAVTFVDQTAHENSVGHDVHLVRLEPGTDLTALQQWMDWSQPHGLESPSPATFLGGTNEMPAGETAYFTVDLEPGRYAWIAEVPNAAEKGMLKTFTVPATE